MLKDFEHRLRLQFPELLSEPFLIACSGGVDSVVLTHLCSELQLNFSLAHVNFQLRGEESDQDQEFVQKLALHLGIPFFTTNFDTRGYAVENKVSIQMSARQLRYQWFDKILAGNRLDWLVTAHHADDNLETFLINLSRGTGIQGLVGIPAKTETIARPLLSFSRAWVLAYAKNKGLQWREDATNSDVTYLRNKIRHEIVPLLRELHPTFENNFKDTQSFLADSAMILQGYARDLKKQLLKDTSSAGTIRISIADLSVLQPLKGQLYLIFKEFGFTAWNDIEALLVGQSGKEVRSSTHRLLKDRTHLILQKIKKGDDRIYYIEKEQKEISHPLPMSLKQVTAIGELDLNTLYVDEKTLKYPLIVRKWQKGDYFHPLGMKGKKKLSKYFKDEKLDKFTKEKQWLLCSENQIVWVVGRRGDNRFRVRKNSRHILRITINDIETHPQGV